MMNKTFFVSFIVFVTSSFVLLSAEAVAQTYTLTDLGVLPGITTGVGRGLNNSGHVVGWCVTEAFLWTPESGMVQLPHYGSRTFHAAYDVNDSDVVVGSAGLEVSGPNAIRAVRWQNGTVENLGVLGTGAFRVV